MGARRCEATSQCLCYTNDPQCFRLSLPKLKVGRQEHSRANGLDYASLKLD
jgi:hypothetical protein